MCKLISKISAQSTIHITVLLARDLIFSLHPFLRLEKKNTMKKIDPGVSSFRGDSGCLCKFNISLSFKCVKKRSTRN